jgi:hypothetical protein
LDIDPVKTMKIALYILLNNRWQRIFKVNTSELKQLKPTEMRAFQPIEGDDFKLVIE